MIRRSLALAVALTLGLALPAFAQDTQWLVGTWVGEISSQGKGARSGSNRTLVIESVKPDGTLMAGWTATGKARIGNITGKLSGEEIRLTTSEDSIVDLRKAPDGKLVGSYKSRDNSKEHPISFTRQ